MQIANTILSGAVGASLAGACLVLFNYFHPPAEPARTEQPEDSAAHSGKAFQAPAVLAVRRAEVAPRPAGVSTADTEETKPEAKNNPELLSEQVQESVEKKFAQQSNATRRDSGTEETLQKSMTTQLPEGSKLLDVECHGTICRLEIEHADRSKVPDVMRDLALGPKAVWQGPTYNIEVSTNTEGGCVTKSFFGQPGSLFDAPAL